MVNIEKVFDHGDYQTKVRIGLRFNMFDRGEFNYVLSSLYTKTKRQKKWTDILHEVRNDSEYRRLAGKERDEFVKKIYLEYITEEEINETAQELYEYLKPNEDNILCSTF